MIPMFVAVLIEFWESIALCNCWMMWLFGLSSLIFKAWFCNCCAILLLNQNRSNSSQLLQSHCKCFRNAMLQSQLWRKTEMLGESFRRNINRFAMFRTRFQMRCRAGGWRFWCWAMLGKFFRCSMLADRWSMLALRFGRGSICGILFGKQIYYIGLVFTSLLQF